MTHLFIVNPVAGNGKALKFLRRIKNIAKSVTNDYLIKITRYPGHATEIARDYCQKEDFRIYSVGGDGTLGEIINGISGGACSLAVIPAGSGNDFSRNFYLKTDLDLLIKKLMYGRELLIDSAKVNSRHFINISSVGFDADVAYMANRMRKFRFIPRSLAYYIALFAVFLKCKSTDVEVTIDDNLNIKKRVLIVAVANGKYYGGGMMPAPEAELTDGYLDVCLIENKNPLEIIRFFPKFVKGKHSEIKGVHFYKGRKVHIRASEKIALNIDGEVDQAYEATFEILPESIRIVVPE